MPSLKNYDCDYQRSEMIRIVKLIEKIESQLQEVKRLNDKSLLLIDSITLDLISFGDELMTVMGYLKQSFNSLKEGIENAKLVFIYIKNELLECINMIKENQDLKLDSNAGKRSNKKRKTCLRKEAKRQRLN